MVEPSVSRPSLLRRAVDASVRPVNLVAPGVGVAAASGLLAVGLAPLALAVGSLSVAAWGAMVAWDVASPKPAPPPPPPPPPPPKLEALHLQQAIEGIRRSAARVRERIDAHDGVLAASLLEVGANCATLVESAEEMARRGDAVYVFLRGHDPALVHREIEERRRLARAARDPEAAASLERAAEAKERQLRAWSELRDLHDRIAAELVAVGSALDELGVRVMQLTLQDPADAAVSGAGVGKELQSLRDRVQVLERSAAATLQEVA